MGKYVLEFPQPKANHKSSRSKYFSFQKWRSGDANLSVRRCNNKLSIISDLCFVVFIEIRFDCLPLLVCIPLTFHH